MTPPASPTHWSTLSSAVIHHAKVGYSCYGFSRQSRCPGACKSRSRSNCRRPAEDALRSRFLIGENGLSQSFHPIPWRRDDPDNPQYDECPMGAVSILRGGLTPEFSPLRPEHSSPRSNFSPTRYGSHPVSGRNVQFAAATIERWYYAARRRHDDPVGALRRAVRKDRGKISLAAPLAGRLILQHRDHPDWRDSHPAETPDARDPQL
jgi:hypothetical protein